jgi:hypothetical protein
MVIAGAPAWATVGALLALIVLIVDIVFLVLGMIDLRVGLLIGGLALARLV